MTKDKIEIALELEHKINELKDFIRHSNPRYQGIAYASNKNIINLFFEKEITTKTKLKVIKYSFPYKYESEIINIPSTLLCEIHQLTKNRLEELEKEFDNL